MLRIIGALIMKQFYYIQYGKILFVKNALICICPGGMNFGRSASPDLPNNNLLCVLCDSVVKHN